jgi:hypothetical protein
VCRPGGRVAVAAWTPEGFVGRTAAIAAEYLLTTMTIHDGRKP